MYMLEYAHGHHYIDSLRELNRDTYYVVIANANTCVVPLSRDRRALQTRLMHAISSSMRKCTQPVAQLHNALFADLCAQVTELLTARLRGERRCDMHPDTRMQA